MWATILGRAVSTLQRYYDPPPTFNRARTFLWGNLPLAFVALVACTWAINFLTAPSASALQTVPYKLNYQGRLTDSTGNVKPNGLYNIKFRLMSASSGGTNLWEGDRVRGASDYRVQVTNGLFSIQLGDTSQGDPALSPTLFNTVTNSTVYLEVELPTPATATCSTNGCATFTEGAMTPRSLLGSSAYAMNADTVDGIDGASLAQLGISQTFTSTNTFTGSGNGTTTYGVLLQNASDSATAFQIQNAGGAALLTADTTNRKLIVKSGSTDATLTTTIDTAGGTNDFTSGWGAPAGWTLSANSAIHTSGTTALTSTWTPTVGVTYQVSYFFTGCSPTNTLTVTMGGFTLQNGSDCVANTKVITPVSTAGLSFTPAGTYTGTLSNVVVKAITQSNTVLTVQNSSGTATLDLRSSGTTSNTFIGLGSGANNTSTGTLNTAIGSNALQSNTTGGSNTASGSSALQNNSTGSNNTATGRTALQNNTTGTGNTANGSQALNNNTTGGSNTGTGQGSLQNNTTGSNNTAGGATSLNSNTTGTSNAAFGYGALQVNTTGSKNTALGYYAGNSDPNAPNFIAPVTLQNATMLGYGSIAQADNSLILGGVGTVASNLTPNVGIGTTSPSSLFSVSPNIYDTGTASTSASVTVVGSGTTWTANMVGQEFIFANGNKYTINGFTDTTHMTLSSSSTNGSQTYRIHNPAFAVTSTGAASHRTSTNTTTAFQLQSANGTNLFVADTTNMMIKVGGGDVSPDASPALLVLDYKNTSGDPTGVDGAMYYNSNSGKMRCKEGGSWKDCDSSNASLQTKYKYQQEFYRIVNLTASSFGGTLQNLDMVLDWYGNFSGTAASITSEANHPGIWRLGTGATSATGNAFISETLNGSGYSDTHFFGNGSLSLAAGVRIPTASNGTETFTSAVGFRSGTGGGGLHRCQFKYSDTINSGKWQGECYDGTLQTCDTGVTMTANNWYNLKVVANSAGTSIDFWVNGTLGCSVTTHIPTTGQDPEVGISKSVGTTARNMDIDYFELTQDGISR